MKQTWAVAWLTFREGLRMRIVLVFLIVLVLIVLRLPFALRGDDTLAGRLQTFLAYSLGALMIFLSLATVFFSCATLSGEIRTRSLHLVVTKPISRFRVLAGKWLGVNLLNVLLVALCGVTIYTFAVFIARQPELFERDRVMLRDVVWTARAAAAPTIPDFEPEAREYVQQRIKDGLLDAASEPLAIAQRKAELAGKWLLIDPGHDRVYRFEHLSAPVREDIKYQIRFKARGNPLPRDELVVSQWVFIDPRSNRPLHWPPEIIQERSGERHQFLVNAQSIIHDGQAALVVGNPWTPDNRSRIVFEGRNFLELLYPISTFEVNFIKSLLLILCRLAFLSAVGLLFSTFTSFPVACFCTATVFLVCVGMPAWLESVGANMEVRTEQIDPYGAYGPAIRALLVPTLKLFFPNFVRYDGGELLIDGEYISPSLVAQCFGHTVLFGCLLVLVVGWLVFRSREVAEVVV
jgi:hypothetical protein